MKKLYGIGTGPGAADLMTLRAINAIKDANVIFAPNNKGKNMALDTAREFIGNKEIILIDFPMGIVNKEDYQNAADIIYENIQDGENGVFLTIGDSMIYSTFIYVMDLLKSKDIDMEIIPGIPSFVAAAAASKTPLTVKGDVFVLLDEYDSNLLDRVNSFALLKTLNGKEEALEDLENLGFTYKYIKRASLEEEEVLVEKEEIIKDKDYISLIIGRKEDI